MNVVENGCKIINVDNSQLDKLKKSTNAFDCGAEKILESLELFIDDLEAKYYYDAKIPYENMFNALKCVVKSAQESTNIRNAIMTGIIQEVQSEKTEVRKPVRIENKVKVTLEVEEVREYAKDKTISQIAEHFEVSKSYIKNFVNWHKIKYEFSKNGRKHKYDVEKIKQLAPDMTISELAKMFMVSPDTMGKFIHRNGIKCHERRTKEI